MSGRNTLVDLVLLVAGLASAAAVAIDLGRPSSAELQSRRGLLLQTFRADAVKRFELKSRGAARGVVVSRNESTGDTRWMLEKPEPEAAAEEAIDALLSALRVAAPLRRVSPGKATEAFGLESPTAVLAIDAGAISYRLLRGGEVPGSKGHVYVRVGGDGIPDPGIVVLAKVAADQIFPAPESLISRSLLPLSASKWTALAFRANDQTFRLTRSETDDWRIEGSSGARVNRDAQRRFELGLTRLDGAEPLDPAAAKRALESTALSVEVRGSAKSELWTFSFGGPCPEGEGVVVLRMSPSRAAGCVPGEVLSALPRAASDLADRNLFAASFDEVERLVIIGSEGKLDLARSGAAFTLRAPQEQAVEIELGNSLLRRILAAKGSLEAPNAPTPANAGELSIKLELAGTDKSHRVEVVHLYPPNTTGERIARRADDGRQLRLTREQAKLLTTDPAPLLPPRVFSFAAKEIRRLSISSDGLEQTIEQSASGSFELHSPKGFRIDSEGAHRLFQAVATLEAKRPLPARDAQDQAWRSPVLRCSIWLSPGSEAKPIILEVLERTREGYLARSSAPQKVFVLSPSATRELQQLAIDHSLFSCGPGHLERLRLTSKSFELKLASDGAGFVSTPTPSPEDEALTEALSTLAPLGLVHLGSPQPHEGVREPTLNIERIAHANAPQGCSANLIIGSSDSWRGQAIHYAWLSGIDAVFALPRSAVASMLGEAE